MPYTNQYDYLIFLQDSFNLSESISFSNPATIFIFLIILSYIFLLVFTIYRSNRSSSQKFNEADENMRKIIQDYRKEILDLSQQNATSFISLSTEPHNISLKSAENYMLKSQNQETELKTLPGGDDHTNPTKDLDFKDASMISQSIPSNISIIHENKLHELRSFEVDSSKPLEEPTEKDNTVDMKEESAKKEEKQIMAPPTFTDRFDMIQNNLAKNVVKNDSSPTLNKSINIDFMIKTPDDLNVKRMPSQMNTRSPKFEQGKSVGFKKKKRVRHNVNTKFRQLIQVSNPIYSTYIKESRFFPKHLRITLIYFEIIFCLFLTTLTTIKDENSRQKDFVDLLINSFFCSFLAWGLFLCFTMILTTDKEKLLSSKNDEDFYSALMNFEREYKYRTAFGYCLIHILVFMFYIQILAFCTVFYWETVSGWIIVNSIVLFSQHFLLDFIYYFLFSSIYVQAYDSKTFKQIYNFLRGFRVWIV